MQRQKHRALSLRYLCKAKAPDVVFAYSTAQNAFCCLVGAILNILCPRERRVFQSKLGVSSSNQCNLHHCPHTGHLEKKIKNGYYLFRTRCIYVFSCIHYVKRLSVISNSKRLHAVQNSTALIRAGRVLHTDQLWSAMLMKKFGTVSACLLPGL